MAINQLSIFLENTPGTLSKLTKTLAENKINIRALSLADTYDFGIARIIVDDANEVAELLKNNNYVVNIAPVVAVKIIDKAGSLNEILELLSKNGSNIEYMYGFTGKQKNSACMILRPKNVEKTEEDLMNSGIEIISNTDLADL